MDKEHVKDYITLSDCYDSMNIHFFDGELPGCVLTFEDKGQHFGYYLKDGFVDKDKKSMRDEIALNPRHFLTNSGDLELLQTLAHEMCHQWQEHFGKPSLRTYHNREWADKMLSIGLVPSSTGKPGGKETGQRMGDYPEEGGVFMNFAEELLKNRSLISYYKQSVVLDKIRVDSTFIDSQSSIQEAIVSSQQVAAAGSIESYVEAEAATQDEGKKVAPSKVKYTCLKCGVNIWGKPSLLIICGHCYEEYNDLFHLEQVKRY